AHDTRGQITTYLTAMQVSQYRTHSFGVIIVGATCRLLRHTQSGTEITPSFDYTTTPHLQTFFWRLSHASPAQRGVDTTFLPVGRELEDRARKLLNAKDENLYKVCVGDRFFFVSTPFTRTHLEPVGRSTRCFDSETYWKCILKDTWRVNVYHLEGEVYRKLHKHQVPNISNVLATGDVLDQRCGYPSAGWTIPGNATIRKHIHYRIVLDIVDQIRINTCAGWIRAPCIPRSHHVAYTKAEVEYRDISIGNIIIGEKDGVSYGLLIDWELARFRQDPREYEGAGTRHFMAARLFADPPPMRTVGDDIESFVLLLLWIAARYTANTMSPLSRTNFLDLFEKYGTEITLIQSIPSRIPALFLTTVPFRLFLANVAGIYEARYGGTIYYGADPDEARRRRRSWQRKGWSWRATTGCSPFSTSDYRMTTGPWMAIIDKDPSVKNEVQRAESWIIGKRKSKLPEYDLVDRHQKRRRGERGPLYQ
ncbi:hypothetical protein B0H14DRAFT_2385497, partial [Mycena olivaceomarginata]